MSDRVYKQVVGIPMGTDCALLLANLFLFYYEFKFIKDTLRNNPSKARKFNFTVRYIDDLLTINNPGFDDDIASIYPMELQLKKTTEASNKLSYLDIMIEIEHGRFRTDVYDKRDGFGFHIVNFPYLCSNIPLSPAYGVYISQLVRIARICDSSQRFSSRNKLLTHRLLQQGFQYHRICVLQ